MRVVLPEFVEERSTVLEHFIVVEDEIVDREAFFEQFMEHILADRFDDVLGNTIGLIVQIEGKRPKTSLSEGKHWIGEFGDLSCLRSSAGFVDGPENEVVLTQREEREFVTS
jgi:hypothetical protein